MPSLLTAHGMKKETIFRRLTQTGWTGSGSSLNDIILYSRGCRILKVNSLCYVVLADLAQYGVGQQMSNHLQQVL